MPELPEVETIRRILTTGTEEAPSIIGQCVRTTELLWERTLAYPSPEEFARELPGQQVLGLGRRGKFLIIKFSQDSLVFHLRMSGDLGMSLVSEPARHDRLRVIFESGWVLSFNDTRKFGRAWLVKDPEELLEGLGPEPTSVELNGGGFGRRLGQKNRQIKPLLMDQHFLSGLGNIYTDEALFRAGIHPARLSWSLSEGEAERLLEAIRETLKDGIRHNGSSIDWVYRGGNFQNYFRVYQQTGNACPVCGQTIQKIVLGQRGTHFCEHCQPFKKG